MLFDISGVKVEELTDELFLKKQVRLSVLRIDRIHPLVSGNKLFKLHFFLTEALQSENKTVLSFGGAYSNHLAATAYICSVLKLKSIGIIRGEKPALLSHTLQQCIHNGMQLKFISRQEYAAKEDPGFINALEKEFPGTVIIPEGGYHPLGAKGAALIMDRISNEDFSHICTATGTATTLAGLLLGAAPFQTIIGIPVLKGMTDTDERMKYLTGNALTAINLKLIDGFDFGGYAKRTDELIRFMNHCWQQYKLPLDFVYTGKMMYAVMDSIKNNYFPAGSNILCVHTGGLQGNKSLPLNTLMF